MANKAEKNVKMWVGGVSEEEGTNLLYESWAVELEFIKLSNKDLIFRIIFSNVDF